MDAKLGWLSGGELDHHPILSPVGFWEGQGSSIIETLGNEGKERSVEQQCWTGERWGDTVRRMGIERGHGDREESLD